MNTPSTILIVDDTEAGRDVLVSVLESPDYRLLQAASGPEALEIAAAQLPDLILLDVMMPDMDGFEVCQRLRASPVLREVPVIFMTALDDRASRLRGIEVGADDFVSKPFDRLELRTRVRTITRLNRFRNLMAERSRFEQVVEFAPDGIVVVDGERCVRLANSAFRQMLHAPAEPPLVGQHFLPLLPRDRTEEVAAGFAAVLAEPGKVLHLETEFLQANGTRFPVELAARHFPWENQPGVQINVRDVTEKKQIEAQFLRSQRLQSLGTLAGGIAHDLNNVLTPISLSVDMLRKALAGSNYVMLADSLETSARRGADIVRQILTFARGVEGERASLQPKHLIHELENFVTNTFPRSIQFHRRYAQDLWSVKGDSTQLFQVLMNLCVNARDAMPNGGQLKLQAQNVVLDAAGAARHPAARPGRYVILTVSDTGTGMTPEVLEKIFEPFYTTKELGKGTGLGLSTTLGIVRSHEGFLTVESTPGQGSQFHVHLPATDPATVTTVTTAAPEPPRGNGELVLVVDDDLSTQKIVTAVLTGARYEVLTANDGIEALALYAENKARVRLVLTDFLMPYLDGPSTIRGLRKMNPEVRVLGMSGLMDKNKATELAGTAEFPSLTKPFTAQTLLTAVADALKGIT